MRMSGKRKIYFAAPLHDQEDRDETDKIVRAIRQEGHLVYVPHEHGVWEDYLSLFEGDELATRKHFFDADMQAMREADTCVASCRWGRGPSEGMIWEMGWMTAAHKNVFLLNLYGWRYNLMPEFGSTHVFLTVESLLQALDEEEFK